MIVFSSFLRYRFWLFQSFCVIVYFMRTFITAVTIFYFVLLFVDYHKQKEINYYILFMIFFYFIFL